MKAQIWAGTEAVAEDLWDWALTVYDFPDVAPACLDLQDAQGQCVSYLLWAIWAGAGGGLTAAGCARAASVARAWEDAVLTPLRAARRALKTDLPGVDAAGRLALRARLSQEELAAERLLLEALNPLAAASAARLAPREALAMAAAVWDPGLPANKALDRLARAFPTA